MTGRSIVTFLTNGTLRSIRTCEFNDSIVKGIYIPRNKLEEAKKRQDLLEPGIYFLFGKEDETGKPRVYIGEGETLIERIKEHNVKKDFWNTAVCFVSEKNNINKAHIKYLENHSCEVAKKVNKYKLENNSTSKKCTLTQPDEAFALSFFEDLRTIIEMFNFSIFKEIKKEKQNLFTCKGKDASAEGEYSEDGMIVFKESLANKKETPGVGNWIKRLRKTLIEQKVMQSKGNVYIFDEDYTFNSPSAAAAVLLGRNVNGWTEWKDKNGDTLDKRIRQK